MTIMAGKCFTGKHLMASDGLLCILYDTWGEHPMAPAYELSLIVMP